MENRSTCQRAASPTVFQAKQHEVEMSLRDITEMADHYFAPCCARLMPRQFGAGEESESTRYVCSVYSAPTPGWGWTAAAHPVALPARRNVSSRSRRAFRLWSCLLSQQSRLRSGCLWFHAASVGEVQGVRPIIAKLHTCVPELPIVLSVFTPAGKQIAQRIVPEAVVHRLCCLLTCPGSCDV